MSKLRDVEGRIERLAIQMESARYEGDVDLYEELAEELESLVRPWGKTKRKDDDTAN